MSNTSFLCYNQAMSNFELVIAEKPSVARDIARVLGAKSKNDGYYIGSGYIVSWCVGHLVSMAEAHAYDQRYKRWIKNDLPIIPKKFQYTVDESKQKQVAILKNLMNRKDVSSVINACDAGREGELIFRLVYNYNTCKKPIKRLWISSLENEAIQEGFSKLKSGDSYTNLYYAAACRQASDWLVGINATRLFSTIYNSTLNVGRVMTPTLSLLVERKKAIDNFVVEPFYMVELICMIEDKSFASIHELGKIKEKEKAQAIVDKCKGHPAIVDKIEKNKKTQSSPKLFDLTSLQREANRMFGYTAQTTLDIAQSLYEKKMITYPRTDSKYLSSDIEHSLLDLAKSIGMYSDDLKTKQVINNKAVTDHHAIIITKTRSKTINEQEKNILNLVAIRFIAAMSPRHEYLETVVTIVCNEEKFLAKGKTVTKEGFKAIEKKLKKTREIKETKELKDVKENIEETQELPKLKIGQIFENPDLEIKEGKTTPPKPYTEASLLSAMETAGVEGLEDDLKAEIERKGLGTPATRAGIIEKLVKTGFVQRKGKSLLPSEKGVNIISVMPEELKTPLLTADWENNLKEVERGNIDAKKFMRDIQNFVAKIVYENNMAKSEFIGVFPKNEYKKRKV